MFIIVLRQKSFQLPFPLKKQSVASMLKIIAIRKLISRKMVFTLATIDNLTPCKLQKSLDEVRQDLRLVKCGPYRENFEDLCT